MRVLIAIVAILALGTTPLGAEPASGPASLPAFLRDTALTLHLRTFHLGGNQTGVETEAWAGGGWLTYESGWLLDTFAMGATLFGSAPLYAPADRDGTLLLAPGQNGYYVPGEAWGALRYDDLVLLRGYRQSVTQGYINPSDIRMTPYTFEGVTVGGTIGPVQYLGGYLWKIKPRNADTFISMAEQAGAARSDGGVGMLGVQVRPWAGLVVDASNQYGVDTFNTLYVKTEYRRPLTDTWEIGLGAEFTDQRAVGAALVTNGAVKYWATQVGGGRVQLFRGPLTLTGAFSVTAAGNTIQNPWGTYPGFLALIDAPASQNFARANEKGWLVGAGYDFSAIGVSGLRGVFNFARGTGAIDPATRARVPGQSEFNVRVDYQPSRLGPLRVERLGFTVRASVYREDDTGRLSRQIHLILNWEWGLLAPERARTGE